MPTELAEPVIELIRQDLLQAVGGISVAGGYHVNAVAYGQTRLGTPVTDGNTFTIDVTMGDETFQDLLCNNVVEKVQEFLFVVTVNQPEGIDEDKTPPDMLMAVIRSDIEKAIRQDITRGGLAHDTLQDSPLTGENGPQQRVIVPRCRVKYRTEIDNAFIVR